MSIGIAGGIINLDNGCNVLFHKSKEKNDHFELFVYITMIFFVF